MDIDLWGNPEVTNWVNKDAPVVIVENNFSPNKTGYNIPI
jgi:hypothetical protein